MCFFSTTHLYARNVRNALGRNNHSNNDDERLAVDVFLRDIAAVLSPIEMYRISKKSL